MLSEKSDYKRQIKTWGVLIGLIIFLIVIIPAYGEIQTKTPTEISIALDPKTPAEGQAFYINGNLSTKAGEPLGNKWVTLESTKAGARPGPFGELTVTKTALDGSFQFYRPPASPPEDLKVIFKGLYEYNSSVSNELSAKK
jgi:hypothetical protein